jgi:DNA-binding NtrC family response regulator
VRELRNLVERLVIMSPGSAIGPADVRAVLPAAAEPQAAARRLAEAVQDFERAQIEAALAAAGGNVTQAATRLGLERSHLYKKMRKLGWRPPA